MSDLRVKRRSFLETLPAIQVGLLAEQQKVQPSAVGVKVTAGVDRFNDVRKLPGRRKRIVRAHKCALLLFQFTSGVWYARWVRPF